MFTLTNNWENNIHLRSIIRHIAVLIKKCTSRFYQMAATPAPAVYSETTTAIPTTLSSWPWSFHFNNFLRISHSHGYCGFIVLLSRVHAPTLYSIGISALLDAHHGNPKTGTPVLALLAPTQRRYFCWKWHRTTQDLAWYVNTTLK